MVQSGQKRILRLVTGLGLGLFLVGARDLGRFADAEGSRAALAHGTNNTFGILELYPGQ